VDNTVGEIGTNVELSLAAGAPKSFIHSFRSLYYTRRPEVPLPQLHAHAANAFGDLIGESSLQATSLIFGSIRCSRRL